MLSMIKGCGGAKPFLTGGDDAMRVCCSDGGAGRGSPVTSRRSRDAHLQQQQGGGGVELCAELTDRLQSTTSEPLLPRHIIQQLSVAPASLTHPLSVCLSVCLSVTESARRQVIRSSSELLQHTATLDVSRMLARISSVVLCTLCSMLTLLCASGQLVL